jgi:zinc transport system substrate-binding protein
MVSTTKIAVALLAALAVGLAAGLGGCSARAVSTKPVAVATIFAYYDALRAIGGDDVESVILLPAKMSPHEYEPTVRDRAVASSAALIVKNGLLIDTWVDKLTVDNTSAVIVDVGQVVKDKGLPPIQTEIVSVTPAGQASPAEEDVSAGNPHIWLDPRVQALAAEAIRDALVKIDPAHADGYRARAGAYLAELGKLDQDFAAAARTFKRKDFIGFHSAYAYLARRYELNQVAAVEELPGREPSPAQEKNIIKLIQDKGVTAVFMESRLPDKTADHIRAETGVKTGLLQPLETYESVDQTYVSLMRANLQALKEALAD